MGRGKAYRRSKTETKKARAKTVLKRHGFDDKHIDRRVGRFVESRWGCNCQICQNPRKLFKGKNSATLTLKEYHEWLKKDDEEFSS